MAIASEIPTEVLTEIFYLLCTKSIFVYELNNSYCKEEFPWSVGLVCRQWRTAFLSYPPIWASLKVSDGLSSPIMNFKARSESCANEINRRLALYLERSGKYPLRLDISLWSNHNKFFTMTALEMLSACSYRWQKAKIDVSCIWQLDSILPCKGRLPTLEWLGITVFNPPKYAWSIFEVAPRLAHACVSHCGKNYGWILPWTQLTELVLTLAGGFIIESGDVPNLLQMLHNIKELRFRFRCSELDLEDTLPQFASTPLNQLRVLEVPHPAFFSWFEAPLLCDLYFRDYQQYDDEPLDVHGPISSLIQRSGCRTLLEITQTDLHRNVKGCGRACNLHALKGFALSSTFLPYQGYLFSPSFAG